MNVRIKNLFLPLLIIISGLSSCYPVDDLTVQDLDIAATLYDKAYYPGPSGQGVNKFEALHTFIIVDTIVHVIAEGDDDNISRDYDAYLLQQVRLNMLKLGFTEETNPVVNRPDVAITVSMMTSDHAVYTWYPYWGWYWGYGGYPYTSSDPNYGSYWSGYYYPWYGYGSYYTYRSGSVLLEMVDVALVNLEDKNIPVIWAGVLNGVLEDSQTNIKNRLLTGIDKCFDQSPYLLKTNK
jgi:hypothetical protein